MIACKQSRPRNRAFSRAGLQRKWVAPMRGCFDEGAGAGMHWVVLLPLGLLCVDVALRGDCFAGGECRLRGLSVDMFIAKLVAKDVTVVSGFWVYFW